MPEATSLLNSRTYAVPPGWYSGCLPNRRSDLRLGHVISRGVERDSPADLRSTPPGHESYPLFSAYVDKPSASPSVSLLLQLVCLVA
jgi:hypothetical protein